MRDEFYVATIKLFFDFVFALSKTPNFKSLASDCRIIIICLDMLQNQGSIHLFLIKLNPLIQLIDFGKT